MGAGVRVIAGERTGYAYSDNLSPAKIRKAAHTAAQTKSISAVSPLTQIQPSSCETPSRPFSCRG